MRTFILAIVIGIIALNIISSCSDDAYIESFAESNPQQSTNNSNRISQELAIGYANQFYSLLYETTRGGVPAIQNIRKEYAISQTRSESENVLEVYIINYEDNKGFAIISSDNRIEPLIAISDNGSYEMSDTIYNKGLAYYWKQINSDYTSSLGAIPIPDPVGPPMTKYDIIEEKLPLLKDSVPYWSQKFPYNVRCFIENSFENAMVGCVPLSLGMIMTVYEWPNQMNSFVFDWKKMKKNQDINATSYLLANLGAPNHLDATYGRDTTTVTLPPDKKKYTNHPLFRTLVDYGYDTATLKISAFAYTTYELIKKYGPMMATTPSWQTSPSDRPSAHAYVIDGYKLLSKDGQNTSVIPTISIYLFHCVWGFGGKDNGYWATNPPTTTGDGTPDYNWEGWDIKDPAFNQTYPMKIFSCFKKLK